MRKAFHLSIVLFLAASAPAWAGDALEIAIGGKTQIVKPGENRVRLPIAEPEAGELHLTYGTHAMTVTPQAASGQEDGLARWLTVDAAPGAAGYLPVFWDAAREMAYLGVWVMRGDRDHEIDVAEISLADKKVSRPFSRGFGGSLKSFEMSPDLRYIAVGLGQAGDWGIPGELVMADLQSPAKKPIVLASKPGGKFAKTPAGHPIDREWIFGRFLSAESAQVCLPRQGAKPECYRLNLQQGALTPERR